MNILFTHHLLDMCAQVLEQTDPHNYVEVYEGAYDYEASCLLSQLLIVVPTRADGFIPEDDTRFLVESLAHVLDATRSPDAESAPKTDELSDVATELLMSAHELWVEVCEGEDDGPAFDDESNTDDEQQHLSEHTLHAELPSIDPQIDAPLGSFTLVEGKKVWLN